MRKKTAEPKSIVIDENDEDMKGTLKLIGGSRSDHWNNILANQTLNTLWFNTPTKRRETDSAAPR